jgi:hypothetical protein
MRLLYEDYLKSASIFGWGAGGRETEILGMRCRNFPYGEAGILDYEENRVCPDWLVQRVDVCCGYVD